MYEYRARVASIWDADTLRVDIDLGFRVWVQNVPIRLSGIDAIELGSERGRAARDWLRALLPDGSDVILITERDRTGKYGRYLGAVYTPDDLVTSVNQKLIDAGWAAPYFGGAR